MNEVENIELPNGWAIAKLNELVSPNGLFCDGDWVESKDQDPNGDIRLIQLADIGDGCFIDKSNRFLTKAKSEQLRCTYLKKGDILVARMPDPLGRATIFPLDGDERYVTVVDVAVIRPGNEYVLSKYCCYMINALTTRNTIARLQSGTTRKRIARTKLETITIPLPPLAEQHRIVDKIDALFSKLDKGVEMLQTIQQQLRTYRQAVLKWAFEGKLTGNTIEKYGRLQDLCFFITKGTTPHKAEMTANNGDVPFIKVYNLTFSGALDFTIDPTYVSCETHSGFLARSKVIPGDVLMNIVGPPLGKVSIAPDTYEEFNINQAIARFRCNEMLNNKFLAYFLLFSGTIETVSKKSKATAGQFNLTLEICRDIEIPLLDVDKQRTIATAIESRLSVCDKLESLIDENFAKAEALRQSILKKAFAGQLVPQDPNDEPAEKMLARIKAEQAAKVTAKPARRKKSG